jgi:hypothetical protein
MIVAWILFGLVLSSLPLRWRLAAWQRLAAWEERRERRG